MSKTRHFCYLAVKYFSKTHTNVFIDICTFFNWMECFNNDNIKEIVFSSETENKLYSYEYIHNQLVHSYTIDGNSINAKTAITAIAPIEPPTIIPDLSIKSILGFSSKRLTILVLNLAHILS